MKNLILVLLVSCFSTFSLTAKEVSRVGGQIHGFNGKMVYFDFVEKDGINQEFPYMENQEMEFDVELDDIQ